MKTLYHLVSTLNASDARSAMYYLSRYLKQAAKFEKYGKDIFEDDKRSAPSDSIRNLTLAMIQ